MIKDIISHPNTPAYIQAIAVIIAAWAGRNYLKKRAVEKKFDLVVDTYKCCLEACDVLSGFKQCPILLNNKESIEIYEQNKKSFVSMVSRYAESYLNSLKENQKLFDNLYHNYAEMRLFFNKDFEKLKPMENLLYARNRISGLLDTLKNSKAMIKKATPYAQEKVMAIIKDGMVQLWENIELTDRQKEDEKEEIIDGIRGVRKYYYLNDMIENARKDIDEIFPEMIG